MSLTPETLPRHELVGLSVRVVDSGHPGYVGIAGRVVSETTATLVVATPTEAGAEPRVRQVPKRGSTFEFALTDEAADGTFPPATGARKGSGTAAEPDCDAAGASGEPAAHVTVDGRRLEARPAERSETTGDSKWR